MNNSHDYAMVFKYFYVLSKDVADMIAPSVAGAWVATRDIKIGKHYALVSGVLIGFFSGNAIAEYSGFEDKKYICWFLSFVTAYFGLQIFQEARKNIPVVFDIITNKIKTALGVQK